MGTLEIIEQPDEITKSVLKNFRESEQFESLCDLEINGLIEMVIGNKNNLADGKKLTFSTFIHSLSIYLNDLPPTDTRDIVEGIEILKKILRFSRESNKPIKESLERLMQTNIIETIFVLFEKGSLETMDSCI